jgi:putative copper export protein
MLFLSIIAAPVLRQVTPPLIQRDLFRAMTSRFRALRWACLGILILTGISNVMYHGEMAQDTPYQTVLHIKVGLVIVVVALSALHDFLIAPRAGRALSRDGLPPAGADWIMVLLAPWMGRTNLVLGVVILLLAAGLTRSH